ncbi:GNAT family N-acetyltransferase [Pseudoalteromonas luteoviolacea]|uniref:GNAT family N-acetyltransferase n=1 Tax=Pseudoalteromonas luteoviolacea TaxID=43657 RepID=UPI0031BB43A7|nr:GNAT family N-acetyltransferase [Pseudoalteromonas luteoviolacea]
MPLNVMNQDVTLRTLKPSDNVYLVNYLNDSEVTRYLSDRLPAPYTLQDAKWWLDIGCRQNALNYAIESHGQFCGVIGAYLPDKAAAEQCAELGYWLAKEFWGKGIGTQAVALFIEKVFKQTQVTSLFNPVSAPNIASIRVMEKAGFGLNQITQNTALHQGMRFDEHVYVLKR